MIKHLRFFLALLLGLVLIDMAMPYAAYAAEGTETVAQATSESTKVTWAWGSVVSTWASAVAYLTAAVIAWAFRFLPSQVVSILTMLRAEQFIGKAIDYGLNAAKDAAKDKVLTVDVGNQVVAEALAYILNLAPAALIKWMGTPEQIAQKIWARLNLEPAATAEALPAIADAAAAKAA